MSGWGTSSGAVRHAGAVFAQSETELGERSCTRSRLPLRELRAATCPVQARLVAFFHAGIAVRNPPSRITSNTVSSKLASARAMPDLTPLLVPA